MNVRYVRIRLVACQRRRALVIGMTNPLPDLTAMSHSASAAAAIPSAAKGVAKRSRTPRIPTPLVEAPASPTQGADPLLSVYAICEELGISEDTWAKWRKDGRGPQMNRLPNRQLRCRRSTLNSWLDTLLEPGEAA
jgi:Helix-turn-helix domain